MYELDEGVALMWQYVDVLDLAPHGEVPQEDLVHLGDAVLGVGKFVVADVDCAGLFGEGAHAFHVLAVGGEAGSPEDVLAVVDGLAVLNGRDSVIESAVHAARTAAPGEEQAEIRAGLFEEVGLRISHIALRIDTSQSSHLILLVLRRDVLTIPEVKLLIAFLIRVVIGETHFHLLPSRLSRAPLQKLHIFLTFFFDQLLRQVFVDVLFLCLHFLPAL